MRIKVLISAVFLIFLVGLICYILHDITSTTTTIASTRLFFKYLCGIGIVGLLFLVIDLLIGFRNIPGYFQSGTARNLVLIALFLMLIILPLMGLIMGMESNLPNFENRTMAERPLLKASSATSFPGDFDTYINDHFGFRKTWITLNNYLKVIYFKISP